MAPVLLFKTNLEVLRIEMAKRHFNYDFTHFNKSIILCKALCKHINKKANRNLTYKKY